MKDSADWRSVTSINMESDYTSVRALNKKMICATNHSLFTALSQYATAPFAPWAKQSMGSARVSRAVLGVSPRTLSARTAHFLVGHSHVRIGRRDADRRHACACATHTHCIVTAKN